MEDIKKEKFLEKSTSSLYINGMKTIIQQMEKCICKIYNEDSFSCTGFFCKIPYPDNLHLLPVLVTTSLAINSEIKNGNSIKISFNDENELREIKINNMRKIFINKELDSFFIEILPEDKICDYLEVDENAFKGKEVEDYIYLKKSVYVLQYPKGEKVAMNSGIARRKKENKIFHLCNTEFGSSGAPILLQDNFKVIGIHIGSQNKFQENYGILINYPISEFIKQNIGK